MPDEISDLLTRLRGGDARAAEELVRQYEPVIRMEVRRRMRDPALGRIFDSMDICQSVLFSFCVRSALGQYDLDNPGELVKLLIGMAQNKLAQQIRNQSRQRRDYRRAKSLGEEQHEHPASDPSPSAIVAGDELLAAARQALSEEERQLADRRALGQSWDQIAAEMGGTAQARRKQLERAIARVVKRFGLNEEEED
jgi:RNA polymerase sigma-70 factor (ECF subfamily)